MLINAADAVHVDPSEVLVALVELDELAGDPEAHRLVLLLGDDFDSHLHVGMHAQHEDARRLHPEVADVERRLALDAERAVVDRGDRRARPRTGASRRGT